jgi:hypothetical protein
MDGDDDRDANLGSGRLHVALDQLPSFGQDDLRSSLSTSLPIWFMAIRAETHGARSRKNSRFKHAQCS